MEKATEKLPVTVLSGFLGAGKATVLSLILNNREGRQLAVIANDTSEINIDASTVKTDAEFNRTEEKRVEMSNSSICCTLLEYLLLKVRGLAEVILFTYTARRPFQPQMFYNFLYSTDIHGKLIRAKGYFRLAGREYSQKLSAPFPTWEAEA